jgi:hypothetical protein
VQLQGLQSILHYSRSTRWDPDKHDNKQIPRRVLFLSDRAVFRA